MKNTEKIGSPVNGQTRSIIAKGVYFIKDGKPVEDFSEGVEKDRLLVIGKYCRFYLSTADLGRTPFDEAQKIAASLGDGWKCPDSFEGRTIGLMSKQIREKAKALGVSVFEKAEWFWTDEVYDRWDAARVDFNDGDVSYDFMDYGFYVLALSAFQD